jgi:spore germination protein
LSKILYFILFFVLGAAGAFGVLTFLTPAGAEVTIPFSTAQISRPEIVGFLPYWLIRNADKDYSKYITTLTYFGLTLNSDGTIKKLNNPQEEEPGWTALKAGTYQKYNAKQSLLVVSGDDGAIGDMIADPVTSANNLVSDVAPIMKDKGFTDLNLDIESFMTASESSRTNFTTFVQTVTDGIKAQKLGTVTLDLIPIALVKSDIYDARALGAIVDRIVLMTYDYHYTGSLTSGANAPIVGAGTTIEYDTETAVEEALKAMPASKILLGVPLYGYEWETIGAAPESATIPGGSSIASSSRVADFLNTCATCSAQFDAVAREPYVIYPENDYFNQIYFENEASMKEKIALAQKYHLGGVALWALGYEDSTMLDPLSTYKNTLDVSGLY